MNRLLELRQAKTAALDSANGILAKLETEKRTAMTTEERASFDGFTAEAESIQTTIAATERMATFTNIPTDVRNGSARTEVYDNILDKPWVAQAPTGETDAQRRARMMRGFGDFLTEVRRAESKMRSGEKGDPRLYALNEGFEKRAAAAGASETVPSDGGFLVYPDFAQEILLLAHETGQIYPRTRKLPLSEFTNAVKIPAVDEQSRKDGSRWGGVQMFWEQEAQALVGSKPTFALLELVTKKLTGLYYATNELLADARLLGAVVMQAFGEEFGYKLDDGVIRGTGAGQLSGILNAACLVTVPKEGGQAATSFVYGNVKKMWGRMWGRSRANAVWLINQDVEQQLYGLAQEVGTGGIPVYLPPGIGGGLFGGATAVPYGQLFGRPVVAVEQCSTLGSVGDVILADFSQYLMVDKGDLQTATSVHVRFLTDEMTYRWIYRTDGQPWWKTALIPAQGTATLSPFIVVAAR